MDNTGKLTWPYTLSLASFVDLHNIMPWRYFSIFIDNTMINVSVLAGTVSYNVLEAYHTM